LVKKLFPRSQVGDTHKRIVSEWTIFDAVRRLIDFSEEDL